MLVASGGLGGPVLCGLLGVRRVLLLLGLVAWCCIRDSKMFSVALPVVAARVGDLRECLLSSFLTVRAPALKGLGKLRYCGS